MDSTIDKAQYRGEASGVFGNLEVSVAFVSDRNIPHRRAVTIPGRITAALTKLTASSHAAPTTRTERICGRLARVPLPGAKPAAAATCSGLPRLVATGYRFYAMASRPRPLGSLIVYHVYANASIAQRAWAADKRGSNNIGDKISDRFGGVDVPSEVAVGVGYDASGAAKGEVRVSVLVGQVSATLNIESDSPKPARLAVVRSAVLQLIARIRAVEAHG
jgi:hypothetical protein